MTVDVLVEDDNGRRRVKMEGFETKVRELAITPWFPIRKGDEQFAVTHIPTGRCVNRSPMSLATAMAFVDEIKNLDWSRYRIELVKQLDEAGIH